MEILPTSKETGVGKTSCESVWEQAVFTRAGDLIWNARPTSKGAVVKKKRQRLAFPPPPLPAPPPNSVKMQRKLSGTWGPQERVPQIRDTRLDFSSCHRCTRCRFQLYERVCLSTWHHPGGDVRGHVFPHVNISPHLSSNLSRIM